MEPNLPVLAKKFWHMLRVALVVLRKGISKSKLLADLNMMMKRGKIAGKAIHNLMFHHSHNWVTSAASAVSRQPRHLHDYEFSCSNSPSYPTFHFKKRKIHHNHQDAPPVEDEFISEKAVMEALEMVQSETASPALPGFGKSPILRQLRITDSPFPLKDVDENNHVDEAAEQFIKNFYKNLRMQNSHF